LWKAAAYSPPLMPITQVAVCLTFITCAGLKDVGLGGDALLMPMN